MSGMITRVRLELRIPLRPDADAVLCVPQPMSESDWDQLMAVLAAMRPGIVRDLVPGDARQVPDAGGTCHEGHTHLPHTQS